MHQPRLVHHLQGRGDLCHEMQRLPLAHAALDTRLQIPARQVLHRQVFETGVHAVVVDLHDQRASDRHDRRVLALEELAPGGFVAQRLGHLQRDVVSAVRAGGQIHHRLLRLADLQAQRVTRNDLGACAREQPRHARVLQRLGPGAGLGNGRSPRRVPRGAQRGITALGRRRTGL